jgi:hypothetical protein
LATKWEYRQEIFQGVEQMNVWGLEGWELAGFFGRDGSFMLLKRPIPSRGAAPAPSTTEKPAPPPRSGGSPGGAPPGAGAAKKKEMI